MQNARGGSIPVDSYALTAKSEQRLPRLSDASGFASGGSGHADLKDGAGARSASTQRALAQWAQGQKL